MTRDWPARFSARAFAAALDLSSFLPADVVVILRHVPTAPRILFLLLSCALAGCCMTPPVHPIETRTAPGAVIRVSAQTPWHDSGFDVVAGREYHVTATLDPAEPYKDSRFACTLEGPTGCGRWIMGLFRDATSPWNPFHWTPCLGSIKRLRVLRDADGLPAHFLTAIASVDRSEAVTDVYKIGDGRTIRPRRSGRLFFFANDWPGGPGETGDARFENSKTYANNRGAFVIRIEPR